MANLDPEDDTATGDSASVDASKPGFQKAWSAWTSKPENNAALLQFGLAMLQPRAPGQTGLGQFASSIGAGGEAANRVLTSQKADEVQAAAEEDKAAQREIQRTTAQSGRITAEAYANAAKAGGTQSLLNAQNRFRIWTSTAEPTKDILDPTGASRDPIVGALAKAHPDIKSKADILANPKYREEARQLLAAGVGGVPATAEADTEGETLASPQPAAPVTPPTGTPRTIYDKAGKAYTWDGITGHAPVAQ